MVVNWIFDNCSKAKKDVTDKGKPFGRTGRKTTGLLNGSWVTEVMSRVAIAHSFEGKNGLFYWVICELPEQLEKRRVEKRVSETTTQEGIQWQFR